MVGELKVESFRDMFPKREETKVNEPDNFERKCTCDWSNRSETGFIPDTRCPVHGENARKSLKRDISYGNPLEGKKRGLDMSKIKFWAVAGAIALFTALIIWRIVLKFI